MIKLSISVVLFVRPSCLKRAHNYLLPRTLTFDLDQPYPSKATRTLSTRIVQSKGLTINFTAPPRIACNRMFSSPCAVIKIVGMGQRSAFNLACRSSPDIPGMRISEIRQPVSCCWPEFKNSSADAKDCTEKPADFSKRRTATRYDSSSSITATILFFLSLAIRVQD